MIFGIHHFKNPPIWLIKHQCMGISWDLWQNGPKNGEKHWWSYSVLWPKWTDLLWPFSAEIWVLTVQTESIRHYVVHNEWPEHVEVWWKIECFGACGVHRNFSTTQPEFLSQWSFQPNIAELLAPEIVDVWGSWKILHEPWQPNPTHEENNKFRTFEICRRPFHMIPDNGGGAGRFGPCGFEKLWPSLEFHHFTI